MPHNETGSFAQSSGKGDSIMVEVARGRGTDEHIPMVLRVPHLSNEDISACFGEYSVLGFGDILIPGFLVAYVRSFDLIATQGCLYYATSVTRWPSPPCCTLFRQRSFPSFSSPGIRGELREIWYGYKPETSLPSEEESELPTMSGKRRNSSDEEERHASTLAIETPAETSVAPPRSAMFPVRHFPPPVPQTRASPQYQLPPRYF
ncbi:hypothetical protein MRX96_024395 [Rhipicephalus microplus]